ncbi:MAG: oxygenase MpaB family protein, partial [Polyangiales bacterium]
MAPQGDRIPTEFRYWDNLPRAQRMRRALRLVFGADPQLPDETVRKWAHGYFDADPIAEQFVDEVYLKRGQSVGRAMVDQALANGVDSVAD